MKTFIKTLTLTVLVATAAQAMPFSQKQITVEATKQVLAAQTEIKNYFVTCNQESLKMTTNYMGKNKLQVLGTCENKIKVIDIEY